MNKNITLQRFRDYSPSSWDSKKNYVSFSKYNYNHWYVAPVVLIRDASILEESNWHYAVETLNADRVKGIEIHRFNHWACGHYELILIHPYHFTALKNAQKMAANLKNYPILDDNDYSNRECEQRHTDWQDYGCTEFTFALMEHFEWEECPYSYEQLTKLWCILSEHCSFPEEYDGNSTMFNTEQVIGLIGKTLESIYFNGTRYDNITITEQIIDRICCPEKYIDINQISLKL